MCGMSHTHTHSCIHTESLPLLFWSMFGMVENSYVSSPVTKCSFSSWTMAWSHHPLLRLWVLLLSRSVGWLTEQGIMGCREWSHTLRDQWQTPVDGFVCMCVCVVLSNWRRRDSIAVGVFWQWEQSKAKNRSCSFPRSRADTGFSLFLSHTQKLDTLHVSQAPFNVQHFHEFIVFLLFLLPDRLSLTHSAPGFICCG